jgi:hypothetical protein
MPQQNDLSRSLIPFEQATTLVAVIELSQSSWLIAGTIPGIERQPLKKIAPDETDLLRVLRPWRDEATRSGRTITRIAVGFEAGRDGFWLARWLTGHGIETHVIHSSSVAVSREHKRAKTDRLDTAMLMRVFLGWLRGERGHCGVVAIPTIEEEDAKRPSRERETLVGERTRIINRIKSALARLGVRGFKLQLRKAPQLLESLRTPKARRSHRTRSTRYGATSRGWPCCANRSRQSNRPVWRVWSRRRRSGRTQWFGYWPASVASAPKRRICWCRKYSRALCVIAGRWDATPGSPVRLMKADPSGARKVSPNQAMPGCAVA